jgi:hypothetical protein
MRCTLMFSSFLALVTIIPQADALAQTSAGRGAAKGAVPITGIGIVPIIGATAVAGYG